MKNEIAIGTRVALLNSGRLGTVESRFPSGLYLEIRMDDTGELEPRRPDQVAVQRPTGAESIL